ncbi:MAG: mannose-1-phosphate guanylyltransferase/mannose-6-phosphate isomerase [Sutterella sp.]|nr:mannose-1-phosphate guanylyltransferase/mannose-6-phosphate isomerase [Sutterella sp.]
MTKITPVIMCGGAGTRLWPLSRAKQPKQFVDFGENLTLKGSTLFSKTLNNVIFLTNPKKVQIVSNKDYVHFVINYLKELPIKSEVILEPVPKNTAPAIALAAFREMESDPETILMVFPSDHNMKDLEVFKNEIDNAINLANQGYLITFGIKPEGPETGYGYIEQGGLLIKNSYDVKKFVEKPCLEKAKEMLASGGYFWNSGIFLFKASVYLQELEKQNQEIYHAVKTAYQSGKCQEGPEQCTLFKPDDEKFKLTPSDSIDYAVLEKAEKLAVVPLQVNWSDMGTWGAFYKNGIKDEKNNVVSGEFIAYDTKNCYINSQDRVTAAIGLDNVAIVSTKDALLVASLDKDQEVKKIIAQMSGDDPRLEALPRVVRPWGTYESLIEEENFKVKKIVVKPHEQLSLQKHFKRAEHWVVVKGFPEITVGETTKRYEPNQHVYIETEAIHRLTNNTNEEVIIIEVQYGIYLGEDDIVRLQDKYLRN